jgi:hypothetical protein
MKSGSTFKGLAIAAGLMVFISMTGKCVQMYGEMLSNRVWGAKEWFFLVWITIFFPPTWVLIYSIVTYGTIRRGKVQKSEEEKEELKILRERVKHFESGISVLEEKGAQLQKREGVIAANIINLKNIKVQAYREIEEKKSKAEEQIANQKSRLDEYKKEKEEDLRKIAEEKAKGFPFLANAYADFFMLEEMKLAEALDSKKHPARTSAQEVRALANKKRAIQVESKLLQYQLNFYESLFPWLTEFKNEEIEEELIRIENNKTQDPDKDKAYLWLTEGEYRSLPAQEKYQLALERYWKRKKSRFEIGRDYERYIGWTYEREGYSVYYQGIIKGFDDLGRDLIVTKGKEVNIIQCKYWARDKTIHEKHIFQLYGTMTSHQIENPNHKVFGHFVTSTSLSDRAKKFADHLGLKISESIPLEEYPCIKCNISGKDGDRIYHLPFDQQYDSTKIEPEKGEFFCRTIAEAEERGFRRAMRHMVNIKSNDFVLN